MAARVPPKGVSEPSYAVQRSEPQPSSSGHNLEDEDHRSSTPPPYSGPTTPSTRNSTTALLESSSPGLPRLNYTLYSPHTFTLSPDNTTLTSYEPRLSTYPAALVSLIQSLATVPPKPQIRITGKGYGENQIDFDVRINIMNLIVPEEDRNGRMHYVKVIGNEELGYRGETKESLVPTKAGGLEEWARVYCEDMSSIKHFALERSVENWDTSYLEGRLLSLVSSTSYRGHVTISFPLTHNKVIVHSPDKFNRFFSSVTKVFTGTKKYEVVKSIWPYANLARGEQGRKCAVQEEEVWLRSWSESIRHAILMKRKGWVTVEDRLESLMEPRIADGVKPPEWGHHSH